MAILKKDELMKLVLDKVKDDTSDEAIKFREDVTDTIDSMTVSDGVDWHQKYTENDASWRKKYADRFNEPSGSKKDNEPALPDPDPDPEPEEKPLEFENLFGAPAK